MATFNSRYIRFAKATTTGVQTITGVGFRGAALMLWTSHQASAGVTTSAEVSKGLTDGVLQSVRHIVHPGGENFPNVTSAQSELTNRIALRTDNTGDSSLTPPNTLVEGEFVAFTADGFSINWHVNDSNATIYHAFVLGGDIDVSFQQIKITVGAGADQAVSGLGFQPDCFIVLGGAADEFGTGDYRNATPFGSMHGFGFSNATDNMCGWTLGVSGAAPSAVQTYRGQHADRVVSIRVANLTGATELCGAAITAVDPDGFTIHRITASGGTQPVQHILCVKGFRFAIGAFDSPGSTGNYTVTLPFRPTSLLLQTLGRSASALASGMGLAFGAWHASSAFGVAGSGGTWIGGVNNVNPSNFRRAHYEDAVLQSRVASTGTTDLQCTVASTADDGVTLNFSVVPASANSILYMAMSPVTQIKGSLVAGVSTTVTAERAISFGLDADTHVDADEGTFTVHGKSVLDGDVHITGDLTVDGSGGGGGGGGDLDDLGDVVITTPTTGQILKYNGSNWVNGAPAAGLTYPLTDPTIASPTTWVNQGAASRTVTGAQVFLRAPKNSGNSVRALVKTAPATPYTVTIGALFSVLQGASAQQAGLLFRDSASGKLVTFHVGGTTIGTNTNGLSVFSWTNPTTFSATVASSFYVSPLGGLIFLRIADNGTNRIYSYSVDGTNFIDVFTEARTTFLTADQLGYFANDSDNRMDAGVTLLSWT